MRKLIVAVGLFLIGFASSVQAQFCPGVAPWVFDDVQASDPFCPNITWMALNSITLGCKTLGPNDRLYCPNDNVTRKSMAAFMNRLGTATTSTLSGKYFKQGGSAFGATAVLGTTDARPLELHVANARVLRIEPPGDVSNPSPNIIGGSPANSAAAGISGATIAGGGSSATFCGPSGTSPCANSVAQDFGSVGGGIFNMASGKFSTVAGGYSNTASGDTSTVAGGALNTASGDSSAVAGGDSNTASETDSTVAGGSVNTASGISSTVAGGFRNTASGLFSTVAGGSQNNASGNYSFAAGFRAKATTTGSFIWADSQNFDFGPSVGNFFGVRATGGVGLTIAIDPTTGAVTQFCNLLPPIASWSCTSDRNAKENFIAADGKDILQRLAAMPLFSWNFKGADPTIRSLGPTAQDFYAAFGLGRNDKSIANVNLEGVALAAIQGLNAKVEEQQRELADLRERVSAAESLGGELAALRAELADLRETRTQITARAPVAAYGSQADAAR